MIGILVSGGVSGGHLNPGLKFVLPETNAEKISILTRSFDDFATLSDSDATCTLPSLGQCDQII